MPYCLLLFDILNLVAFISAFSLNTIRLPSNISITMEVSRVEKSIQKQKVVVKELEQKLRVARAALKKLRKRHKEAKKQVNTPPLEAPPLKIPQRRISSKEMQRALTGYLQQFCKVPANFNVPDFDNERSSDKSVLYTKFHQNLQDVKGSTAISKRILRIITAAASFLALTHENVDLSLNTNEDIRRVRCAFIYLRLYGPHGLHELNISKNKIYNQGKEGLGFLAQLFSSWFPEHPLLQELDVIRHVGLGLYNIPQSGNAFKRRRRIEESESEEERPSSKRQRESKEVVESEDGDESEDEDGIEDQEKDEIDEDSEDSKSESDGDDDENEGESDDDNEIDNSEGASEDYGEGDREDSNEVGELRNYESGESDESDGKSDESEGESDESEGERDESEDADDGGDGEKEENFEDQKEENEGKIERSDGWRHHRRPRSRSPGGRLVRTSSAFDVNGNLL